MSQPPTQDPSPDATPPKARKSRWKRWLMGMGVVAVAIFLLLLFGVPLLVSSSIGKGWVSDALAPYFRVRPVIGQLSFSWTSGATIRDLEIPNPDGYANEPAIRVDRVAADIGIWSLVRGRYGANVHIENPHVRVQVRKDGRINLEDIQVARQEAPAGPARTTSISSQVQTDGPIELHLDFALTGGRIDIADEQRGVHQSIENLEVKCRNEGYAGPLEISLDAVLKTAGQSERGKIALRSRVDINKINPLEHVDFETTRIDLAAYESLVEAVLQDRFESFKGIVAGKLAAQPKGDSEINVTGDIEVRDLDIRGGPFKQGRGLVAPLWKIHPNLRANLKTGEGTLDGTRVDLGFATVTSLPASEARNLFAKDGPASPLGLRIDVDLATLAKQPILPFSDAGGRLRVDAGFVMPREGSTASPFAVVVAGDGLRIDASMLPDGVVVPAALRLKTAGSLDSKTGHTSGTYVLTGTGIDARGDYSVGEELGAKIAFDIDAQSVMPLIKGMLPSGLSANGKLLGGFTAGGTPMTIKGNIRAPRVTYLGNEITDLSQDIELAGGQLSLSAPRDARFNGGPLRINANLLGMDGEAPKFDFDVSWTGGKAEYGLTPLLQYAVPLLAGLPTDDVTKLAGVDFKSTAGFALKGGGPLPKAGGALLDALTHWGATGSLDLANGGFRPSAAFSSLLQFVGDKTQLRFDDIKTKIKIEGGRVYTQGFRMGGKDGVVTLAGSTGLGGDMKVKVDFTDLLRKHKIGQKVLAALKNEPVTLDLAGTLWKPEVGVEDLVSKTIKGTLQNAANDLLRGLGGGKKPKDALEDLLRGFGHKKKKKK